ncbi:pantetheine-phosphate adenylyltransferase [Nanchangia anserum]|uniref:Phosphopantetheine adenylyltransferase n=1 Tax=Nanchangia anserum TaxID=2692125 RepID=A0A8I0GCG2_9ACTO|nr:pantetheine-phosphate adenylyltransferase [Nanchangia anserum]QOX82583.1 pantetheine-phosphate adenylyltransferase [Nanchangia anserum]
MVPGSFDPPTLGHCAVIERCLAFADRVVVAVATNAGKTPLFSASERVDLLRASLTEHPRVEIVAWSGLVADLARREGAQIVKGVRGALDAENEITQARLNADLGGVETLLLPAQPQWAHVSSSAVREIARCGGDVRPFVSVAVAQALATRLDEGHRHEH